MSLFHYECRICAEQLSGFYGLYFFSLNMGVVLETLVRYLSIFCTMVPLLRVSSRIQYLSQPLENTCALFHNECKILIALGAARAAGTALRVATPALLPFVQPDIYTSIYL